MLSVVTMYFPQCSMPDLSRLSKPLNSGEVSRMAAGRLLHRGARSPWKFAALGGDAPPDGNHRNPREGSRSASLRLRYPARDGVNKTARTL